jgi:general stress protein YciG
VQEQEICAKPKQIGTFCQSSRARFVLDMRSPRKQVEDRSEDDFSTLKEKPMATSKRGFASMDASKQREIASKGGRAAHSKGTAHEFTSDEARVAGRKGGEAVSRDRAHMAAIGREGGHSRGARARAASGNGGNTDVAQGSGSQPFVREANDDRGANFESGRNSGSSFGSQERSGNSARNEGSSDDSSLSDRNRA